MQERLSLWGVLQREAAQQEQGMYREIASCAGCSSIQYLAEALHILACRPYGEDNCTSMKVMTGSRCQHLKTAHHCGVQTLICSARQRCPAIGTSTEPDILRAVQMLVRGSNLSGEARKHLYNLKGLMAGLVRCSNVTQLVLDAVRSGVSLSHTFGSCEGNLIGIGRLAYA